MLEAEFKLQHDAADQKDAGRIMRPTLVSLFTGAGGLDLGLEDAGFETLLANEIEPYACESLRSNRLIGSINIRDFDKWFDKAVVQQRCYRGSNPKHLSALKNRLRLSYSEDHAYLQRANIIERDVRFLSASDVMEATKTRIGEIDLIAGGPPCQPFSRAGKRELVDSDTGQLFLNFVRIVNELRPRWFLFENVKGLVIHKADVATQHCFCCHYKSIVDFEMRDDLKNKSEIVAQCRMCGNENSHDVTWEKRKAGSLEIISNEFSRYGYQCYSIVLNAADYGAPQQRERLFIVGSRDKELIEWPHRTHSISPLPLTLQPSLFDSPSKRSEPWLSVRESLYTSGHWRYGHLDPHKAVLWVKNVVRPHDEPVTWGLDRPAPTIGAHQAAKLAIAPNGVPEQQLRRQQWHVLGRRQSDTSPVEVEHEYLSDDELLRLQTFPVSWYLHGTRMQRAFQIGNAVPPILAKAIGNMIMASMGFSSNDSKMNRGFRSREVKYASSF